MPSFSLFPVQGAPSLTAIPGTHGSSRANLLNLLLFDPNRVSYGNCFIIINISKMFMWINEKLCCGLITVGYKAI